MSNLTHTVGTTAVIIDGAQVLLIRRRDFPLWALPGGGLDPGETIQECCVREVKEETGFDIETQRLIGLYHRERGLGRGLDMTFLFICRVLGGSPHSSDETSAVRYWPLQKLPANIPAWHRLYLDNARDNHPSALWRTLSTPLWVQFATLSVYRLRGLINLLRGRPKFQATRWRLGVFVTLFDADGHVLLVQRRDHPVWNLPGGKVEWGETAWDAAVREAREETGLEIQLQRLTGIYCKPTRGEVVLSFEGCIVGGQLITTDEGVDGRYFPIDALPTPTLPKHVARIHDSACRHPDPVFRTQDTPSGLKVLGFR
jgi:ADP-ribose pyrophosphatase YjhB (NUDIX family)